MPHRIGNGTPAPKEPSFEPFRARCERAGFDIVHRFALQAYDAQVAPPFRLRAFDPRASVGLLVGNTKALWDILVRALDAEPACREREHPLDQYTRVHVTEAAKTLNVPHTILWAEHSTVPVQRIAHVTGLAWLSPSHLSIHPRFGPWLGFRAVVLIELGGTATEQHAPPDPCGPCHKPCLAALDAAVSKSGALNQNSVNEHFDLWRRVRDVCPRGSEYRYDEAQLRYHYTKEKQLLRPLASEKRRR